MFDGVVMEGQTHMKLTKDEVAQKFISTCGKRPKVKDTVAAAYLGLSRVTLQLDRAKGHLGIPFYRIGRAVVYDLDEVDAWFESRSANSKSA